MESASAFMHPQLTVGVIGKGVVGSAVARTWMEHAEVRCYDLDRTRRSHNWLEVIVCDYVFLCLPTPADPDGRPNLDAIETICGRLKGYQDIGGLILKSTVPIGTTRWLADHYKLTIVHSPEFLTARCSLVDAQTPSRNIIGGVVNSLTCGQFAMKVCHLHEQRFPGVRCLMMTSDESEAVKLMANNFFAAKVAFFNEWKSWADARGLNWARLREGVLSDGRIAHAHTAVPGPDGERGFGGSCLPKDLLNTLTSMQGYDFTSHILAATQARNRLDRRKTDD